MKVFKNKGVKFLLLGIVTVIILLSFWYRANKALNTYRKVNRTYQQLTVLKEEQLAFKEETVINNSYLAEMMVQQQTCHLDSQPHHVLCIGNSITTHQPSDEIGWHSSHGMAASKLEFDYCHVLEKLMKQLNPETTITPVSLVSWERNFSINIDSLLKEPCEGKDIIVIRIGENVVTSDIPKFEDALSELINYCSQYTNNIVLTGEYWPDSEKELAIIKNAYHHHLKYVPIYWIWNLHKEECCPKEGDTLYNTEGLPYTITGNHIVTHPNDKGMELIANSIYGAL